MAQGDIEVDFQTAVDAGKILGGHVCATDSQGKFVYEKTFGSRTLLSGEKVPYQIDDVHYLASATKLLATIAALKCVEEGILTLTGSLSKFAPELDAQQVITGYAEDGETPIFEPQKQPITLEMLITHSSGLTYPFIDERLKPWHEKNGISQKFPEKKLAVEERFLYPLVFQPGTGWMYGSGLDWAGRVVERATGKSLGDYLQEKVFDPLGINSAQFYPVAREDLQSRMVDLNPNDPEGLGKAVAGGHDSGFNKFSDGHFGGHGLYMSAADYIKVQRSLLANDGKILQPSTVNSMFEQHLSPEAAKGHEEAMASPKGIFFRVGVPAGTKAGYGLGGLLTQEDLEGWFGEGTLSWGGGHTIAWFVDRKNDLCGFVAVQNTLPVHDMEIAATLKQVFREDIYRKRTAAAK